MKYRAAARIELSSTNGVIKLSDVTAEILFNGTNGAIELLTLSELQDQNCKRQYQGNSAGSRRPQHGV